MGTRTRHTPQAACWEWRMVGQAEARLRQAGPGSRVSAAATARLRAGRRPRARALGVIIRNSITIPPLRCFSSFPRTVPQRMWSHFWKVSTQGLFVAMFWPLIPQFVCNCLFYWALYFNPIINIDLVVKEVRRLETQVF